MESGTLSKQEAYERIAQIMGCKWSVRILDALANGSARPSELLRECGGLAERVLHRCLNRLQRDGLISKRCYAEIPPHTEYELTAMGKEVLRLLESAWSLADRWEGSQRAIGK